MTDTLVSPGSDPGPTSDPAPTDSGGGGGLAAMPPKKKLLLGVGGIGLLLVIYLYAKNKSKNAASSATSSTGVSATTPTLVLPSSSQDAQGSSDYASLTNGLGSLSNQVSQLNTQAIPPPPAPVDTDPTPVATAPAPTPVPAPTPAPTRAAPIGYADPGTTVLGGNEFYVLGGDTPTHNNQTYQVTNGAPVYFTWNGQGVPRQGPPPATATGLVAYTPVSTPKNQIQGPNQQPIL